MPDAVEHPDPEKPAPKKRRAATGEARLNELKEKYRLNQEVRISAKGGNGLPLGLGPLLDPQVFDKFAELDKTKNKRYLDWMLFQAGGGQTAFDHARELWGDNVPEESPEKFFDAFNREKPSGAVGYEELRDITQRLSNDKDLTNMKSRDLLSLSEEIEKATKLPDLHQRFLAVIKVLTDNAIAPGHEKKVALEIVSNKFKTWMRKQLSSKTRDRVHATSVFSRLVQGVPREVAEEKWRQMEGKRRYEFIFGDQDSLKWNSFGFHRHWPGRNNLYETIYNTMREFLTNTATVERYNERVAIYNEKLKQREGGDKLPTRKPLPVNLDIGKVVVDAKGNLKYVGDYENVSALERVNNEIEEIPARERVSKDIRYAGPPGKGYAGPRGSNSRTAKIYSDENIDVRVPLTVAAAIEAGNRDWPISNPSQIQHSSSSFRSRTPWTKYASGEHEYAEWKGSQLIPVIFEIKNPVVAAEENRFLLLVFLDDLVDLHYPFLGTKWRIGSGKEIKFNQVVEYLRSLDHLRDASQAGQGLSVGKSILKAMKTIKHWGQEFNPQDLIGNFDDYYKEQAQKKRSLGESLRLRAQQAVEALIE